MLNALFSHSELNQLEISISIWCDVVMYYYFFPMDNLFSSTTYSIENGKAFPR